ncbi:MAG TPA: CDP-alcohol phosphatidyltransferase family protein [Candidatus Dormibacteraeota bacterium]|nr:CDP-alcohol phosphatidyltransferase family protein [Candidatus Dormibacteraeota bacterium]
MNGSLVSTATRQRVRDLATPVARGLGRLGLTPNALTLIGFLGTCVAAVAAAWQAWLAAGVLVLVFGIFDLFDGALARATGRATKLGAFLDSTFDRAGEAIVSIGIAVGCLTAGFNLGAILAASAMAAAFMVSYTRAKSESLGFTTGTGMAAIGLAPREVRLALLAIGLLAVSIVGPVGPPNLDPSCPGNLLASCMAPAFYRAGDIALGGTLGLIAILATITTIQRILHVARAEQPPGRQPEPRQSREG